MRVLVLTLLIVALFGTCAVAKALDPTVVNVNLAPNSSFEDGVVAGPNSWTATGDGVWVECGHAGDRAIGFKATPGGTWHSAVIKAEDDQSYRANGWIACRSGAAVLGFDLLDKDGKVLATAKAPALKPAKGWTFTAVEADAPAGTTGLQVWFRANGEAYLDDVVTAAIVVEQLFNPTFKANSKGGVTFWDSALTDGLEGTPKGTLTCDPTGGRGGSSALLVSAPEGWFAARNLESAFPMLADGLMVFKFTGYSRTKSGQAPLFIGWMDRQARMIRKDSIGAGVAAEDGWMLREAVVTRPQEALAIKPLAVALNGEVLYDEFSLRAVEPVKNIVHLARVHVNQVGYEANGAKSLVVATNFYPTDSNQGTVEIMSDSGRKLVSTPLFCGGRVHNGKAADWGYYFWRADFSSLKAPGKYRAVAAIGGTRGESYPFGLSKQSVSVEPAKDYFFNPSYVLGMNFLQLGRAWAGGLTYRLTGDQRALRFGADQIDWVMGKNPHSLCMVEGAGSLNPNWYHHRYCTIPGKERGAVPGAVANGMVINLVSLDIPGFDVSWPNAGDEGIMRRKRPSFRTSEPWLVHNMHLLLALSSVSSATPPAK